MNINQFLKSLNNKFSSYSRNGFYFQRKGDFAILNQGQREVIVNGESIKATPWFDDVWIVIYIKFKYNDKRELEPYISIVFFQEGDLGLKTMFRAEWDSYVACEGYNHPQPHWHILVNEPKEVNSFDDFIQDDERTSDFAEMFSGPLSVEPDVYKMHFAMAGSWIENGNMITDVVDEESLVEWIYYLLIHVRKELEYVKS